MHHPRPSSGFLRVPPADLSEAFDGILAPNVELLTGDVVVGHVSFVKLGDVKLRLDEG